MLLISYKIHKERAFSFSETLWCFRVCLSSNLTEREEERRKIEEYWISMKNCPTFSSSSSTDFVFQKGGGRIQGFFWLLLSDFFWSRSYKRSFVLRRTKLLLYHWTVFYFNSIWSIIYYLNCKNSSWSSFGIFKFF